MYPGGRKPSARQMEAMMRKMGIKQEIVESVERVVILTKDREIVFRSPDVTAIKAPGQTTYQIVGTPEERPRADGTEEGTEGEVSTAPPSKYSEEDVALVMEQTGASEEDVHAALEECEGEVAEAIIKLIS